MYKTEQSQTRSALTFSFTTITSTLLLLKLTTNSRKCMSRKASLARRDTDDSISSQTVTTAWTICHDQEPQSSTTEPLPLRAIAANPKNDGWKWSAETGTSREIVRPQGKPFVLHENSKSPKMSRVVLHDLAEESRWYLHFFVWSKPPKVNELASSSPKMEWILYNNPDDFLEWCDVDQNPDPITKRPTHDMKVSLCFFFCSEWSAYWEIPEKVKLSTPLSSARNLRRWRSEFSPVTLRQGKISLVIDNVRPHREKNIQQKLKDLEMKWLPFQPIPRISLRAISMHFEAWKSAADGTSRTARTWSSTADLDRDQASRLLEERTRTTTKATKKNCENAWNVLWRSQECLNCLYLPPS